ncbi:MAG: hypothetical protein ABIN39_05715 [candidate division WOR-3 bacterium]
MFWDIYFHNIFNLPNSGVDSEMYYYYAVQISNYESFSNLFTRGGLYSFINGVMFIFIGTQRIIGQYLNVIFGLNVIILVFKILNLLNIDDSKKLISIAILAVFPNSLIMSGIFLRESIITFLATISLYYFTLWFLTNKNKYMFHSILFVGLASAFHSGMIALFLGYAFSFLFYSSKYNNFIFSKRTIFTFLLLLFVFIFSYFRYQEVFFAKFTKLDQIEDYFTTVNSRLGGSAYLKFLKIDSPLLLVLFGPIKFIYFYIAPLPIDWRNIFDVITFLFDSLLYLYIMIKISDFVLNEKNKFSTVYKNYVFSLIMIIVFVSIIFGSGVGNTGTALRHRQKFISNFIVLLALINLSKKELKK